MRTETLKKAIKREYPDAKELFPEYMINCPRCNDRRKRCGINVVRKMAHCFNCGVVLGVRKLAELLKIREEKTYDPNDFEELDRILESVSKPKETSLEELKRKPPEIDIAGVFCATAKQSKNWSVYQPLYEKAKDYIEQKRGFDFERLSARYKLVLPSPNSRERGRLLLPVFEGGYIVYYQARALYDQKPKYLNPTKEQTTFGKSNFIFNLEATARYPEIVVCEGIFSALSVGEHAVAIFGKELSDRQAFKLLCSGVKTITILFDPGEEHWAEKAAAKLFPSIRVKIAHLVSGDPNEVSEEELTSCLHTADNFQDPILNIPDFA